MNIKRLIAAFMSLCFMVCVCTANVIAGTPVTFKIDSAEVNAGEEFAVNISLADNPGIAGFNLRIGIDNSVIKPVSYENKSGFALETNINPASGVDINSVSNIIFACDSLENITSNGTIITLKFKAEDKINVSSTNIYFNTLVVYDYLGNDIPYSVIGSTVNIKNPDVSTTTETTTVTTTSEVTTIVTSTTETTTETSTVASTSETTTETSTEETSVSTPLDKLFVTPVSPNSTIQGDKNVIDYSQYKNKEITINLMLSNVENTDGLNNYTLFLKYNPKVIQMTKVVIPQSLDGYSIFIDNYGKNHLMYSVSSNSMSIVPGVSDIDYTDMFESGATSNTLSCAELGKVKFANYFSDDKDLLTVNNSGIFITLRFKIIGEGSCDIITDSNSNRVDGFNPRPTSSRDIVTVDMPGNLYVYDMPDYIIGDCDGNGMLSANDSATVLQKSLDYSFIMNCETVYPNEYFKISDVNNDEILTANDAAFILQKALNSSFKFTAES